MKSFENLIETSTQLNFNMFTDFDIRIRKVKYENFYKFDI